MPKSKARGPRGPYKQKYRLVDGGPIPDCIHHLIDRTGIFRTYFQKAGIELKRGEATIRGARLLPGGRVELSRAWWSYYRHLLDGTPLPEGHEDDPVIHAGQIVPGSWDALIAHFEVHNAEWKTRKDSTKSGKAVYFKKISEAIGKQKVAVSLKAKAPHEIIARKLEEFPDGGAANMYRDCFSLLCEHARKELEWIETNPIRDIAKPKSRNKKGHHTMTEREIAAWRAAHPDPASDARAFFEIGLAFGARANDLLQLGWKNIEDGVLSFTPGKTDQNTAAEVHLEVSDELLAVLECRPKTARYFFQQGPAGVIALRPRARSYNWVKENFPKWRAEADLDHVVPHSLRKTFATRMANAGATVNDIADALGDTIESAQVYIKARDKKQGSIRAQRLVKVV